MELRPTTFCPHCYEKVNYEICTRVRVASVREVTFSFSETYATCNECGHEVYVPAINDKNCFEREKEYYHALKEMPNEPRFVKRSIFL